MRKIILTVVIVLTATITSFSQSLNDISIIIGGGLSVPVSENNMSKYFITSVNYKFASCWNTGFNLTGGFAYNINTSLSAHFIVDYSSFPINKSMVLKQLRLPAGTYVQDAELTTVAGKVGVRYKFPYQLMKSVVPYVTANAGIMNIASDEIYVLIDAYSNYYARFKNTNVLTGSTAVGVDILGGDNSAMFVQLGVEVANTKGGFFYYLPLMVGFRGGL